MNLSEKLRDIPGVRGTVEAAESAASLLDDIHLLLDGKEWNRATTSRIAELMTSAGYEIHACEADDGDGEDEEEDGWTRNTGVMPVPTGTLVDVIFRDGAMGAAVPAGEHSEDLCATDWSLTGDITDIVSWRLA